MISAQKLEGAGGHKVSGSVLTLIPTSGSTIDWDGSSPLTLSADQVYTVTANSNANVSVKIWGAGGACGYNYSQNINSTADQGPGGGGGFTSGVIAFVSGQTYKFCVGQGGIRSATGSGLGATYLAGGLSSNISASYGGTQGGGYTGIFLTSTISQANALLIAGGGGAGADSRYGVTGGAGGGASGGSAAYLQGGTGGSQSEGGLPSIYNGATAGSALMGGISGYNAAAPGAPSGGGGGGYFGGGGGNVGGGGGGSGYFKPSYPVSSASTTVGSGATPGNSADPDRGTSGQGGIGGATSGANGRIFLTKL